MSEQEKIKQGRASVEEGPFGEPAVRSVGKGPVSAPLGKFDSRGQL
jgi:hypothetical protein